jgi:Holliday junction resolvase RusA-like endonuclease
MLDGAIRMMLMVYVPVPKSAPKKKREQMLLGEIRPLTKPDNSNILKGVEDALNGVAYIDDKQICDHDGIHKFYSENPRIEVTLREV